MPVKELTWPFHWFFVFVAMIVCPINNAFSGLTSEQCKAIENCWADPKDALEKLWEDRAPFLDDGRVRKVPRVPKIQVSSTVIPPLLSSQLKALLEYKFEVIKTSANEFLPVGTEASEWFALMSVHDEDSHKRSVNWLLNPEVSYWEQGWGTYSNWGELFRTSHQNERFFLPSIIPPPVKPKQCPDVERGLFMKEYLKILSSLDSLTNQEKLICIASRFAPPKQSPTTPPTGYLEVTHVVGDPFYSHANASGRIVWSYMSGRVYYTPSHYCPWLPGVGNAIEILSVEEYEGLGPSEKREVRSGFFEIEN